MGPARGVDTPRPVGPPASRALAILRKNKNLNCNQKMQTYNWRVDAFQSYLYALRMKALSVGSIRPATPAELYWQELHGQIP